MHRKKRIAGLLTAVLISAAVAGCSTSETTNTSAKIASYSQGELMQDAFYDKLVSQSGLSMMLEMVDKGILDVVQPVDDDMTAAVEENLSAIKEYYGEEFEKALAQNGFKDEAGYTEALYLNLQRNAYISDYVEANVLEDTEIQTYYDEYSPEIEASHILIKPEGDTEVQWEEAKTRAEDLIRRYEAGETFEDLAMTYSDDTGSGMAGGALGAFGKGAMVPEFEEAAFALDVGDFTKEPVKTQFGYHIILKTAGEEKQPLEEMHDEIVKNLVEQKLQEDETLGYQALKQMREDNGFSIDNPVLKDQYKTMLEDLESK